MNKIFLQFFNKKVFSGNEKFNKLINTLFDTIDVEDFEKVYKKQFDQVSALSDSEIAKRFVLSTSKDFSPVKSVNDNVEISFTLVHNYVNKNDTNSSNGSTFFTFNIGQKKFIVQNSSDKSKVEVYRKKFDGLFDKQPYLLFDATVKLDNVQISAYSNEYHETLKYIMEEFDVDEKAEGIA